MRLVRMSLQNWRGVAAQEIAFDDHITLIEGPNEIGKSTIIEAIRMLFRVMASSSQKSVKAVQPVGHDTGSRVEAEIRAGDHHFIYSKTYNKEKQTTLNILAPRKEQLTGREAHDRVQSIMAASVDMVLWEALLLSQGKEIAQASLGESESLARALDQAAGTAATGVEEPGFFDSVKTEYERYFTPTGKAKFSALGTRRDALSQDAEVARTAMAAVEEDAQKQTRCAAEVLRRKMELPGLAEKVKEHEKKWQLVSSLQEQTRTAEAALETSRQILEAALRAKDRRETLIEDIAAGESKCKEAVDKLQPLEQRRARLSELFQGARKESDVAKASVRKARAALALATGDDAYLSRCSDLHGLLQDVRALEEIQQQKFELQAAVSAIKINEPGLEKLRALERKRDIARSRRDTATATVIVRAKKSLSIKIDGQERLLPDGDTFEQKLASQFELEIPEVASVEIIPSRSVDDLQQEVSEAEEILADALQSFGADSIADAIVLNEKRLDAERDLTILKDRERTVARTSDVEELRREAAALQKRCHADLQSRPGDAPLPESSAAARHALDSRRSEAELAESSFEATRSRETELQQELNEAESDVRVLRQEIKGLESALEEKRGKLEGERANDSDESTRARQDQERKNFDCAELHLAKLKASLAEAAPDAVQLQCANAKAVEQRAIAELQTEEQTLAVLQDRLGNAQADGRFERLETAQRDLKQAEAELADTSRRAAAVKRLWSSLNRHREDARKAYVRPLKEAIEELAAIVFGGGCEVDIAEDWRLVSRSLNGATIPFEDLSIGAQEQLGIITRLAASQIIARDGGVPLIIDDALGFSDPARLESMGAAIASVGRRCQIILITCTPGRFTYVGTAATVKL